MGGLALNRQTDIDSSLIRKFNGIANQVVSTREALDNLPLGQS